MKKLFSTFLIVLIYSSLAFATNDNTGNKSKETTANNIVNVSENVNISGTIVDLKSNETLAGATILVDGKKYYSDLDGNFNLSSLALGKHHIAVEMISYKNAEMEIDAQKDTNIKIQLLQQ
ncbi:conserved exported hypothetical protein [uncultured Paludibacter sp.]|uniref:TonB-dependent receptor n=1 Tax=uncultured Paludibacter sp. TaxID=497635 RepID=A0A653ACC6_9BACT|nr:conserved exported hypothetical protein [uncultured Paludibacter sp.]